MGEAVSRPELPAEAGGGERPGPPAHRPRAAADELRWPNPWVAICDRSPQRRPRRTRRPYLIPARPRSDEQAAGGGRSALKILGPLTAYDPCPYGSPIRVLQVWTDAPTSRPPEWAAASSANLALRLRGAYDNGSETKAERRGRGPTLGNFAGLGCAGGLFIAFAAQGAATSDVFDSDFLDPAQQKSGHRRFLP